MERKIVKRLFEEFLWAVDNMRMCELIKECYENFSPNLLHDTALVANEIFPYYWNSPLCTVLPETMMIVRI